MQLGKLVLLITEDLTWFHGIWMVSSCPSPVVPILWPPDAKSQLIRKDPDSGKD